MDYARATSPEATMRKKKPTHSGLTMEVSKQPSPEGASEMDIKELLTEMAQATNKIDAKVTVLTLALEEVIRVVPADPRIRTEIAQRLRARVDQVLLTHQGSGDMVLEGAATHHLAVLLTALGQPPER